MNYMLWHASRHWVNEINVSQNPLISMGNVPRVMTSQWGPFPTKDHELVRVHFGRGLGPASVHVSILRGATISRELGSDENWCGISKDCLLTRGSFETAIASCGFSAAARRARSSRICSSFVPFLVRRLPDVMPALTFAASVIKGVAGCTCLLFGRVPTMGRKERES